MDAPTAKRTATSPTAERPPLGLGTRLFLTTGALVALSIGAAIALTSLRTGQIARQTLDDALVAGRTAMSGFETQRYAQLELMSRLVASDPNFVAYVAESDPASVRDLLEERRASLGCDFAMVLDRKGRVLARTDRAGGLGEDQSQRPLVAEANAQGQAAGIWREGERLHYAAAVPLLSGANVSEGLFIAGFAIDDALALEMKRLGATEVAYLTLTAGAPRVFASTLGAAAERLDHALDERRDALRRAMEQREPTFFTLRADGRMWDVLARPLRDGSGPPVGAVLTLASLDQRLAPFSRIVSALVWLGLLTIVAAFAVSWTLSRRITRPIEELVAAAEAARAGRFEQRIDTTRTDEVGRLARAFDGLLAELREKRDMEVFVSRLSRNLPDATAPSDGIATSDGGGQALAPGALFADRFEVLSVLGTGGMGVVYKARDRELGDLVALKTLHHGALGSPQALERLKTELRLARRITHPNVLRTHDFGDVRGVPFISMEYVRGVTLRYLLDQTGRLPFSAGLRLARQLCAGLQAAHREGVLHRDIKPENLIIEPTGDAKLADFGIARPVATASSGASPGTVMAGTVAYMAPETLQGRDPDARADLYACGVVLYETFTGALPYGTADPAALFFKMANEKPAPPRSLNPDLPLALDAIVMRCLALDPAARYASVDALLADLEGLRA